jgi:hypothetical protein
MPFLMDTRFPERDHEQNNLQFWAIFLWNFCGTEVTLCVANEIKKYQYAKQWAVSRSLRATWWRLVIRLIFAAATDKARSIQSADEGFSQMKSDDDQSICIWILQNDIEIAMKKKAFPQENHIYHFIDSGARWSWGNVTALRHERSCGSGKRLSPDQRKLQRRTFCLGISSTPTPVVKARLMALKTAHQVIWLVDLSMQLKTLSFEKKIVVYDWRSSSYWAQIWCFPRIIWRTYLTVKSCTRSDAGTSWKGDDRPKSHEKLSWVVFNSALHDARCETQWRSLPHCYGMDLARNRLVEIGKFCRYCRGAVHWVFRTQLTMRSFHTGWVAKEGGDITTGLDVEELEARTPKYLTCVSLYWWRRRLSIPNLFDHHDTCVKPETENTTSLMTHDQRVKTRRSCSHILPQSRN